MKGVFDSSTSLHDVVAFSILILKPSPLRWILFGLLFYIPLQIFFLKDGFRTIDKSSFDGYIEGTHLIETILRVMDPLFLSDLQFEGQTKSFDELNIWERIKWTLLYKISPRGIGWQREPTHALPQAQKLTRSKFLLINSLHLLAYILCIDICCLTLGLNPSFSSERSLAYTRIWNFLQNFIRTWVLVYCGLNMGYTALSLASVGFHLSKPDEWPALFGPLTGAYTVQRFWGRVWHQLLRKPFTAPPRYLAHHTLGLPHKSKPAFYVLIFGTFLISGIYHAAGEYNAANQFNTAPVYYFLSQAVAITLEDLIHTYLLLPLHNKKTVPQTSPSPKWRWGGYVWVIAWLTLPPPMVQDLEIHRASDKLWWKVSPIMGVLKNEWFPR